MRRLLKEPLVHFILLGGALFVWHSIWEARAQNEDYTVTLSQQDLDAAFQKTLERKIARLELPLGGVLPDADKAALREDYIENEVLLKEARRMGLGQNDETVQRRLLQKMRFMISEMSEPDEPSEAELRAYYDANASGFVTAERRKFREIVLFERRHGDNLQSKARDVETALKSGPANWYEYGDPMAPKDSNAPLPSEASLTREYGREFAGAVFALETEQWSGPIASPFGVHFIYVEDVTPAAAIPFEDAKDAVEAAWREAETRGAYENHINELVQKYKVVTGE